MGNDGANRLNLYDYFGFPDREKRDEALQICNITKLRLLAVEDEHLRHSDLYFEQYSVWSYHISNFSSHLWLHFLLMYYQYSKNPLDTIGTGKFQSPETAHKIFFDTLAEDVAVYLISYFDKHLKMYYDLYDLNQISGMKRNPSRKKIIDEMENIDELKGLAKEYQRVEQSVPFRQIIEIRNNFVHNKSLSYHGMQVTKYECGVYASGNSSGISTKATYNVICELLRIYEQLCTHANAFIKAKIEVSK